MPRTRCHSPALVAARSPRSRRLLGSPEQVRRLEELGLRSGAHLEIVRGGSPCIVRIDGSTLCFRHDESLRVLVTPRKTA